MQFIPQKLKHPRRSESQQSHLEMQKLFLAYHEMTCCLHNILHDMLIFGGQACFPSTEPVECANNSARPLSGATETGGGGSHGKPRAWRRQTSHRRCVIWYGGRNASPV